MHRAAAMVSVTNRLEQAEVPRLLEAAGKIIGRLAEPETVIRVAEKNADAVWLFTPPRQGPAGRLHVRTAAQRGGPFGAV